MHKNLEQELNDLLQHHGYSHPGYLLDNLLRRRQGIQQLTPILAHAGYEAVIKATDQRFAASKTYQALFASTRALLEQKHREQ